MKPWNKAVVQGLNFLSHPTKKRDPWGSNMWQMHKQQGRACTTHRFHGKGSFHSFKWVFCHIWRSQYLKLTSLQLENKGQVYICIKSLKLTIKPTPFDWMCLTILIATLYLKLSETWHNLDVHSPIFITGVRKGNGRAEEVKSQQRQYTLLFMDSPATSAWSSSSRFRTQRRKQLVPCRWTESRISLSYFSFIRHRLETLLYRLII